MPKDPDEEAPECRCTYRDISNGEWKYPAKIHPKMKKILKRKKPNWFKKYLMEYTDVIIVDLFSPLINEDGVGTGFPKSNKVSGVQKDIEFIVNALK